MLTILAISLTGCDSSGKVAVRIDDSEFTAESLDRIFDDYIKNEQKHSRQPSDKKGFVELWIQKTLLAAHSVEQGYADSEPVRVYSGILERRIILEKMGKELILKNLSIDDEDLERQYRETPLEIKVLHYKNSDRAKVEKIVNSVKAGQDIEDLLIRQAIGSSKLNSDNYISRDNIPDDLDESVFNLDVGEISEIMEKNGRYHLVLVTEKRGYEAGSFEEQYDRWKSDIFKKAANERRNAFIDSLLGINEQKVHSDGMVRLKEIMDNAELERKQYFDTPIDGIGDTVLASCGDETITIESFFKEQRYTAQDDRPFLMAKFVEPFLKGTALEMVLYKAALERGVHEIGYIKEALEEAQRTASSYYMEEAIKSEVFVTAEEIDKYITERAEEFTYPERIVVREIVVGSREEAWEIYQAVENGSSFKQLAVEQSESQTAGMHGRLGPFKKERRPFHWNLADTLESGGYTRPTEMGDSWILLKLLDRIEPVMMQRDYCEERARAALSHERAEKRLTEFVNGLKDKHDVWISKEYS